MARAAKSDRICFVVAPFGEAGSATRQRSDNVLRIIAEAARGYTVVRADKINEPGIISKRVIKLILDAPLVVADLTGANPNVYYELALRHAAGKPCIQIIDRGEKLPFNVRDVSTLEMDRADALAVVEALVEMIREIERPDFVVENPVSAVRRVM